MKNRAFTLIELLAAIVIISLLSLLTISTVSSQFKNKKDELYQQQLKTIEMAAEMWGSENKEKLTKFNDQECISVTLGFLKEEGYVDEDIKNPSTNELLGNDDIFVNITKKNKGYRYNALDRLTKQCYDINKIHITKDGLILWYDGIKNTRTGHNDNSTVWEDLSGNNNDALLNNVIFSNNSAVLNRGSQSDGIISSKITVGNKTTFEIFYSTEYPPEFLLDMRNDNQGYQPIYLRGNNSLQSYNGFSPNNSEIITNNNLIGNDIINITLVYDEPYLYLYVNGELDGKISQTFKTFSSNLYIGRRFTGDKGAFKGNIYSVRVYNDALTPEKIKNNYQHDKIRFKLK